MSRLLAEVLDAAHRAAAMVQGGNVVYRRGNQSVRISAVFGRSEFPAETTDAVRTERTDRDFLFQAESLILGGQPATPQKGDRITIGEEDEGGEVFEVLPADGKQCYRTSGPTGSRLRVYTKKVSHGDN